MDDQDLGSVYDFFNNCHEIDGFEDYSNFESLSNDTNVLQNNTQIPEDNDQGTKNIITADQNLNEQNKCSVNYFTHNHNGPGTNQSPFSSTSNLSNDITTRFPVNNTTTNSMQNAKERTMNNYFDYTAYSDARFNMKKRKRYGYGLECERLKKYSNHYKEPYEKCEICRLTKRTDKQFYFELGIEYNQKFQNEIKSKEWVRFKKFSRPCKRNLGLAIWFFEDILDIILPWLKETGKIIS